MRKTLPALVLLGLLGACTSPPPEAYVAGANSLDPGEPAGQDSRGEACLMSRGAAPRSDLPVLRARDIFCGGYTQPAARVAELRGPAEREDLMRIATGGLWRTALDSRVAACAAPQETRVAGNRPALLLSCTRRNGGWPHVALVAQGPEGPVLADGVPTVLPVIERIAAGQAPASGGAAVARSAALELAAQRQAAAAFGANEVGGYERLMALGRALNQAESFAAAEDAYRGALAIQERVLGAGSPDTVTALMHLALNLSNQDRRAEAEALFARAAALAPRAADPVATIRLRHYRGLHELNANRAEPALALLREAEAGYATLVPPALLRNTTAEANLGPVGDAVLESAILGLAEVWRSMAAAVARGPEPQRAAALAADSRSLLRRTGLEQGLTAGRGLRSEAAAAASGGRQDEAAQRLEQAARRFNAAAPGERPEAVTLFLAGRTRAELGRGESALQAFRTGAAILRARQIALPVEVVMPYLDTLHAAQLAAGPDGGAALRREMFSAAQLAQRSGTVRFVQLASARIGAASGDPRVADAVRRLQDADRTLRDLYADRDAIPPGSPAAQALDRRIADLQRDRAEAEGEVAAAAPGYRQLLLASVDADAVTRALDPDEVLVTMLLGRDRGYVLAMRGDGRVAAHRTALGDAAAAALVQRVRAGMEVQGSAPGSFDTAAAAELHAALLAPLSAAMDGVQTMVVAPDGPLLGLPFGLLLTGPADPAALGAAPWLIRRHAVVHVPSPQTLVTQRAAGRGSSAPNPYRGFGDFAPPSAAQLAATFPEDRCAADARLAAGLGRLPGTRAEVLAAQRLTGAAPDAVRLGTDFTGASLRQARLDQYRVIHLATHALLPGELSCLPEPAIVVSAPPGARDASAAFIRASEVLGLRMDADLVVLSACNTGGPGGEGGGEALSGLARSFFYAGARGLLVTHWAVDDAASALLVADTLRRQGAGAPSSASLRGAQLLIVEEAGRRLPAAFAHPYYWAAFALIGDGRRAAAPTRTASVTEATRL
ncbi:CHAT domain-containing protein [Falsiroseomonas sp. CW058]|uniref:CHAT domain-containing protein n=1 Tax=Falsiroseomonas sp. CW058 TaxID=3388664 RepID=UPI003D31FE0F